MVLSSSVRKLVLPILILLLIPISLYAVSQVTSFFSRGVGNQANILVDTAVTFGTTFKPWKGIAQGGEEQGRMLFPVIEDLKLLRPEYIRIDHVLDYYDVVSIDQSGQINFDWTKLDRTLSDIREIGATPFISISYTPTVLSGGNVTDPPRNWQQWEFVVSKLVEHVSGRGGLAFGDVYWEVWNEPDLFGGYKLQGEHNYLELYLHTYRGIKAATNTLPFKVGGPATTAHYKNWLTGLLRFVSQNGIGIDFYSWHWYGADLATLEKDLLEIDRILADFPEFSNIELVVSEWGIDSKNNKAYDRLSSAIHTMGGVAAMADRVDKTFIFEAKDGPGPSQYWGRWGLLTHESFGNPEKKPRYQAVAFLNRMVGNKLNIAGQGTWVKGFATKDGNVIRLFLVNYDPNGRHSEFVPITFANLPSNTFTYRRIDFLGQTYERQQTVDSNSWTVQEEMFPNSATIFEIILP